MKATRQGSPTGAFGGDRRASSGAETGAAFGRDWPVFRVMVALFLLGSLAYGWPWLSGRMTMPWDAKATFLPQIQFLAQSLASGQSPAWLPYVFSGFPQIADPQAMIFSPPFLLLAAVSSSPSLWAVDVTVLAMIAASGLMLMMWFADRGWHWAGGLIAALAFCYGASMAWRIQHVGQVLSLAYLPFALFLMDRALDRRSALYGLAAGLVAGFILLGRDQVALLEIYMLAAYALWRLASAEAPVEAAKGALAPAMAGGFACVLLIAAPLLLTAEFAAESNRPHIDFAGAARGSLHPALLMTLIAPDLYGAAGRMEDYWGPPSFAWQGTDLFVAQNMGVMYLGAIPLLLVAFASLRGDLWRSEIRFFTCAAAVMLLYALGKYTPIFQICYALVPGVGLYRRPADATFLVGGLTAILAGYALNRLIRDPLEEVEAEPRNVAIIAAGFAAALVGCVLLGLMIDRMNLLPKPLALAVLFFAIGAAALVFMRPYLDRKPLVAALVLGAVTAGDLAYNNGPSSATALPTAHYDVLQPDSRNATIAILKSSVVANETRRDRVELAGLGFHWPNASITHKLENTLGYNPVRLALYSAATGAEDHVGLPDQRKFSPLFPSYRSTLANLLGLRYIVTGAPVESMDKRLSAGDLPLLARTSDGYIYENKDALDRVLFVTEARPANFTRMLQDGQWPDFDPSTAVLLDAPAKAQAKTGSGRARIVSYTNTHVVLEAESDGGGWVVLNDLWHRWWFAEVDGKPAPIARANVLFRAVEVPPGKHRIEFRFKPLDGAFKLPRAPRK